MKILLLLILLCMSFSQDKIMSREESERNMAMKRTNNEFEEYLKNRPKQPEILNKQQNVQIQKLMSSKLSHLGERRLNRLIENGYSDVTLEKLERKHPFIHKLNKKEDFNKLPRIDKFKYDFFKSYAVVMVKVLSVKESGIEQGYYRSYPLFEAEVITKYWNKSLENKIFFHARVNNYNGFEPIKVGEELLLYIRRPRKYPKYPWQFMEQQLGYDINNLYDILYLVSKDNYLMSIGERKKRNILGEREELDSYKTMPESKKLETLNRRLNVLEEMSKEISSAQGGINE